MDLSDAYANAPHIPDAAGYPTRWARAAEAFRADMGGRAELNQRYGESERQAVDLFHPEGEAKGTVVFVHGGYWRAFGRSDWSHLAAGPLARNWTVAMPGYDLCPRVRISEITQQIATAIRAVARWSRGPLVLCGHSAGGHLVARMLDPRFLPEDVASRLRAVVPISPLCDLRPLMRTDMNRDFRMDAAEAEAESPLLMAGRRAVPVQVVVGGAERPAFLDQARWLAEAWNAEHLVVTGRHHFDVIDGLEKPASQLTLSVTPD